MSESLTPIERLRVATQHIGERTNGLAARGVRHDAADDVIGTFHTDDGIGFDPFPMLALMQSTGANYAIFGQVAGIMHGSIELTGDLDILWDGGEFGRERMAESFAAGGVKLRDEDGVISADLRASLGAPKTNFEGIGCAGDLCTPKLPWGALDVTAFLGSKVWAFSDSLVVPYLALEDVLSRRPGTAARSSQETAERGGRAVRHMTGSWSPPLPIRCRRLGVISSSMVGVDRTAVSLYARIHASNGCNSSPGRRPTSLGDGALGGVHGPS
jgi:hypothetical protein